MFVRRPWGATGAWHASPLGEEGGAEEGAGALPLFAPAPWIFDFAGG